MSGLIFDPRRTHRRGFCDAACCTSSTVEKGPDEKEEEEEEEDGEIEKDEWRDE